MLAKFPGCVDKLLRQSCSSRKDMPEVDLVGRVPNQIRHASFTPPPIMIRHTAGSMRSIMSEFALSGLNMIYMDSDALRGQTLG